MLHIITKYYSKCDNSTVGILGGRGEEKQSHENRKNERKCKQENVLHSYYDGENSKSENPVSWEFAGAEIQYVSAPSPQLQLGRPPRAGRKMVAILIHPNWKFPHFV